MDFSNVKNDLSTASIRIQARQFLNLVQEPIAANLASKIDPNNADPGMKDKLIKFFGTESGKAIFGILVSLIVETFGFENDMIKAINKEIRIESMAVIGDEVADVVMGLFVRFSLILLLVRTMISISKLVLHLWMME